MNTHDTLSAVELLRQQISVDTGNLMKAMGNLQGTIDTRVNAFTEASDRSAKALTFWTKVLAFSTIGLVVATLALVVIEWMHRGP